MRSALATGLLLVAVAFASSGCAQQGSSRSARGEHGEVATWNQARVTGLAQELVVAADAVQDGLRRQPTSHIGSGQSASFFRLQQYVRRIRTEARHFAAELEAGKGYEETAAIFEGIDQLREDAAENARKIFLERDLLDQITTAGSLLNRLRPYYNPASFDPR